MDIFVNEEGEEELFPLEHPQKQEMVCEKSRDIIGNLEEVRRIWI